MASLAPPYKRSIVEKTTLMTQDVTGARYAATDADPSSFVVPGAASVKVEGATFKEDTTEGVLGERRIEAVVGGGAGTVEIDASMGSVRLSVE